MVGDVIANNVDDLAFLLQPAAHRDDRFDSNAHFLERGLVLHLCTPE